jgi:translation initiation factor 6 (eIF-6)
VWRSANLDIIGISVQLPLMTLPSNFNLLVEQIDREITNLDTELSTAIQLVRARITLFPNNISSIQLFALLSNYALFSENTRKRIQETIRYLTTDETLSSRDIEVAGEDLSEQLGRILETKIVISNIRKRLEN